MSKSDDFQDEYTLPGKPGLAVTIQALRDYDQKPNRATIIDGLSDLDDADIAAIKPIWAQLKPGTRRKIMRALAETCETDFMLDYRTMGSLGLDDSDPGVRQAAINALWMDDSVGLMNRLMVMARNDPALDVRAAAILELGRFIALGDLGDLPEETTRPAQELAIKIWQDSAEPIDTRRRALEAISRCSHPMVNAAITEAYAGDEHLLRVSAVFAMGSTCDERWADTIMVEIENDDPEMRYEAARAAGALELVEAVPVLGRLAEEDNRETLMVVIWSLGEIGGKEALRFLAELAQQAEENDDETLADAVDEAIANATLMNDLGW